VLYAIGTGALFGEACCFSTGFTGEASVWARTPCVLYFFRRETVEEVIAREHPELILEMVGLLGYIVRMFAVWMRDSLTQDYFERVCRILVYYVEWKGVSPDPATGEVVIHADLTQNDLARLLGIHRISVAKAVRRLKETGILLRFTKRVLHIADFPRLVRISGA
jgi:CRP-like cAMP-binding protein